MLYLFVFAMLVVLLVVAPVVVYLFVVTTSINMMVMLLDISSIWTIIFWSNHILSESYYWSNICVFTLFVVVVLYICSSSSMRNPVSTTIQILPFCLWRGLTLYNSWALQPHLKRNFPNSTDYTTTAIGFLVLMWK